MELKCKELRVETIENRFKIRFLCKTNGKNLRMKAIFRENEEIALS